MLSHIDLLLSSSSVRGDVEQQDKELSYRPKPVGAFMCFMKEEREKADNEFRRYKDDSTSSKSLAQKVSVFHLSNSENLMVLR